MRMEGSRNSTGPRPRFVCNNISSSWHRVTGGHDGLICRLYRKRLQIIFFCLSSKKGRLRPLNRSFLTRWSNQLCGDLMACKLGVACYHKDLESTGLQHFRCCCVGLTYDNIRNQRDQKITFICKLQIYAVMIGSGGSRQETLIHRARARMKTPYSKWMFFVRPWLQFLEKLV